jgi:bisphosphoglycerate-independent phosphoglycerate mutase (AlkP superfamily)
VNLFSGLVENKMPEKVLDLLDQTNIQPDQFTLTTLFSACAQLSNDRAKQIGRKLLDQMPKHFETNNYIQNSAINMLMKFGDVQYAEQLFQTNKKIDVVTYGAMMKGKLVMRISQKFDKLYLGYVENKMSDKALDLFEQIPFTLHDVGYTIVFNACAQLSNDRAKQIGRKLLDQMPKHFETNNFIRTSAISMLMKFGDVQSSEKLFQKNKKKDLITYGAMMKGKLVMRVY